MFLPFSVPFALVTLQKAVVGKPSSAPVLRGEEPQSAFSYLGAPRAGWAAGAWRAFAGTSAIFQHFELQAGAVPGSSPRPSAARPDAAQGPRGISEPPLPKHCSSPSPSPPLLLAPAWQVAKPPHALVGPRCDSVALLVCEVGPEVKNPASHRWAHCSTCHLLGVLYKDTGKTVLGFMPGFVSINLMFSLPCPFSQFLDSHLVFYFSVFCITPPQANLVLLTLVTRDSVSF